jgi:hypothetical protein
VVEIADAIAVAYPQAVARIVSATRAPDTRAAAAMLFEGLLRPGFDPARGADTFSNFFCKKPPAVACPLQGYALVSRDIHIVTGIACLWVKDAAGRHSLQHTDFHWPEVPQSWAPKCGLSTPRHITYARM